VSGSVLAPQFTGLRAELIAMVGGMERFVGWFDQRTFSPERLARTSIEDAVSSITTGASEIYDAGGSADDVSDWIGGYKKRWLAYQSAGSRTLNWMITGPARFPVDRNRKRMDVEHKRLTELLDYEKGVSNWIARRNRAAERREVVAADAASGVEHKEKVVNGVRCVLNKALDRVQLIFPGKPSDDHRALLKSNAFRWAPSVGAWQRQLTQNGVWAAERVLKSLDQ